MKKVFTADYSRLPKIILFSTIVLVLTTSLFVDSYYLGALIPLAFLAAFVYITARTKDTAAITVDDEAKLITFVNKDSLGNRTTEAVPFEKVFFTYRTQQISRYDKGDVCVIDSIKKTYAVLEPRQRGWQNADIRLLAEALSASKIRQVTEKYDDKDISL